MAATSRASPSPETVLWIDLRPGPPSTSRMPHLRGRAARSTAIGPETCTSDTQNRPSCCSHSRAGGSGRCLHTAIDHCTRGYACPPCVQFPRESQWSLGYARPRGLRAAFASAEEAWHCVCHGRPRFETSFHVKHVRDHRNRAMVSRETPHEWRSELLGGAPVSLGSRDQRGVVPVRGLRPRLEHEQVAGEHSSGGDRRPTAAPEGCPPGPGEAAGRVTSIRGIRAPLNQRLVLRKSKPRKAWDCRGVISIRALHPLLDHRLYRSTHIGWWSSIRRPRTETTDLHRLCNQVSGGPSHERRGSARPEGRRRAPLRAHRSLRTCGGAWRRLRPRSSRWHPSSGSARRRPARVER